MFVSNECLNRFSYKAAIGNRAIDKEYCHRRRILGSSLWHGKQKAIHGISSSRFSECKEIQNCSISKKNSSSPSFWMQGACFTRNFWLKDQRWIPTGIVQITIPQATHPQNQAGKKHVSFVSRQRKATLQCTNSGRHDKPEIHSGSTPFVQPRFGTVRLLVVFKIEGDVKRSKIFHRMPKLRQLRANGSAANRKLSS